MEIIVSILIFIGMMYVLSKLGLGCCGGHENHSDNQENNNNKSCCSSKKQNKSKDVFEK